MNSSKKTQKKKEASRQSTPLRIEVDYSNRVSAAYANYAAVTHSVNEFFIDFCILAPPYNVKAEGPIVYAQPITRIIMPLPMAQGLMDALETQIAKQKETQEKQGIEIGTKTDEGI